MGMVDTNMGWPMFTERDGDAVEVGDRKPPRDGVKTGVGMEGGMSSKSSKRSKFDFGGRIGSGFLVDLVALVGLASSSELDVSELDSVSGLVSLVGALALDLIGGATFGFVLPAATILTVSGSESDDSSSLPLLLESDCQSQSWNLSLTWLLLQLTCGLAHQSHRTLLLSVHLVLALTCQISSLDYPSSSKDYQQAWAPPQSSHWGLGHLQGIQAGLGSQQPWH